MFGRFFSTFYILVSADVASAIHRLSRRHFVPRDVPLPELAPVTVASSPAPTAETSVNGGRNNTPTVANRMLPVSSTAAQTDVTFVNDEGNTPPLPDSRIISITDLSASQGLTTSGTENEPTTRPSAMEEDDAIIHSRSTPTNDNTQVMDLHTALLENEHTAVSALPTPQPSTDNVANMPAAPANASIPNIIRQESLTFKH